MARGLCVVKTEYYLCDSAANRSKYLWKTASDSTEESGPTHPPPMPSKSKVLKCNKVTRLCIFLGLIFLRDGHPHRACASASLESFHWKRPLSIIMASLGRAVSVWRGFYFDNSLWAVWSSYEGKYSTTFQASEHCFKTGFFFFFF